MSGRNRITRKIADHKRSAIFLYLKEGSCKSLITNWLFHSSKNFINTFKKE